MDIAARKLTAGPESQTMLKLLFSLGIIFAVWATNVIAETGAFRVYAGDSLAIDVQSRPDLKGSYTVDELGQLTLPVGGAINVSGLTTQQIRSTIVEHLKEHLTDEVQVSVTVERFRPVSIDGGLPPIFIDGDVSRPGAYPYDPGMTVGVTLALAGGRYSVRSVGSLVQLSHEREQSYLLLDAHRSNIAREARLLAELANQETVTFPADLEESAENDARVREILRNELAIMHARKHIHTQQFSSLKRGFDGLTHVLEELESQLTSINERRNLYEQRFKDIESLAAKGVVPKDSLLRLQITATTLDQEARAAQISIIQTRQALEEARSKLDNYPVEREAGIIEDLQTVQDSLAQSKVRFEQTIERLAALNVQMPPNAAADIMDPAPAVSITRAAADSSQSPTSVQASWNSPVLPGDVIWVPFPELTASAGLQNNLPARLQNLQDVDTSAPNIITIPPTTMSEPDEKLQAVESQAAEPQAAEPQAVEPQAEADGH